MPLRKIAFIKWGSFSNVNPSILEILRREFPHDQIDIIDVSDLLRVLHRSLWFKIMSRLCAYWQFGRLLFLRREKMLGLGGCLIRTRYYFNHLRRAVLDQLAGNEYFFTFQTQSLFDASVLGTPHFVYTDHAEMQCLDIPGFRKKDLFPPSWINLEKAIYHNARLVFTFYNKVSKSIIEQYGCPPENVVCVSAGSNSLSRGNGAVDRAKYSSKTILFVALRWDFKGGPVLIEAFRRVLRVHSDAQLIIVGCLPEVDAPNCRIIGRVPLAEVNRYYESASVYCLPTLREAFGGSFIEAFSHKLPVIATAMGAMTEYVKDGHNGYLVPPNDAETLAARLIDLVGDPVKCELFGGRGYELVQARYSWEITGELIRSNIERAVADRTVI
jgi:glycosyltransferase involved in cell wall biosynthesis